MNGIYATVESFDSESGLGVLCVPGIRDFKRVPFHASVLPEGFLPEVGTIVRCRIGEWATQIVPEQDTTTI